MAKQKGVNTPKHIDSVIEPIIESTAQDVGPTTTAITLSVQQKRDYAKLIYLKEPLLTQGEIAERVGISLNSLNKWINAENWAKLKKSLLTTKQEELSRLYDQLSELNTAILKKGEGLRYADSKQADIMSKITSAIRNMETDISIGDTIDVFMKFNEFVRQIEPDKLLEFSQFQDSFIKSMM